MSTIHLVYIPLILVVGLAFGYALGARAVRAELSRAKEKAKE